MSLVFSENAFSRSREISRGKTEASGVFGLTAPDGSFGKVETAEQAVDLLKILSGYGTLAQGALVRRPQTGLDPIPMTQVFLFDFVLAKNKHLRTFRRLEFVIYMNVMSRGMQESRPAPAD